MPPRGLKPVGSSHFLCVYRGSGRSVNALLRIVCEYFPVRDKVHPHPPVVSVQAHPGEQINVFLDMVRNFLLHIAFE